MEGTKRKYIETPFLCVKVVELEVFRDQPRSRYLNYVHYFAFD